MKLKMNIISSEMILPEFARNICVQSVINNLQDDSLKDILFATECSIREETK